MFSIIPRCTLRKLHSTDLFQSKKNCWSHIYNLSQERRTEKKRDEQLSLRHNNRFLGPAWRLANLISVSKAKIAIWNTALRTADHDNKYVQLLWFRHPASDSWAALLLSVLVLKSRSLQYWASRFSFTAVCEQSG